MRGKEKGERERRVAVFFHSFRDCQQWKRSLNMWSVTLNSGMLVNGCVLLVVSQRYQSA